MRTLPFGSDRGNTGVAMVVAAPFLMAMLLTLVSLQQFWDAQREAQAIADEGARIAAQADPEQIRLDPQSWTMSEVARTEAEEFMENTSAPGTVISGTVTAGPGDLEASTQVTIEVDYIFDLRILPDAAKAESTAQVLRGISEDGA